MYADDTQIYFADSTPEKVEVILPMSINGMSMQNGMRKVPGNGKLKMQVKRQL